MKSALMKTVAGFDVTCRETVDGAALLTSTVRLDSLLGIRSAEGDTPELQMERRVSFGRFVASLDPSLSVELRLETAPSPESPTSAIAATVILRGEYATDDSGGTERFRKSMAGFYPVLRAHFPEGELRASAEAAEPDAPPAGMARGTGWRFGHALLEIPLGPGLPRPRAAIGFGARAGERSETDPGNIAMVIPWVPTGSDWRRLAEVLAWTPIPLVLRAVARAVSFVGSAAEAELLRALEGLDDRSPTPRGRPVSMLDDELIRARLFERRNSLCQAALRIEAALFGPEGVPRETATAIALEISGGPSSSRDPLAAAAGAISCEPVSPEEFDARLRAGVPAGLGDLYSAVEASGILRLPSPPAVALDGFPVRRSRTSVVVAAGSPPEPGSVLLGVNAHRGVEVPVHLSPPERRRHVYVVGQTGTGKSTLLERMILQDIRGGRGCAVLDPHGDLVQNVLARMPMERARDVVILDFQEEEYPIGLNPLMWTTMAERDFIVEEVLSSILSRYHAETTGPIFEVHARNFLKLLMGDAPRADYVPNILDLPLLYQRKGFRRHLLAGMADPSVVDFVTEAEVNTSSEHRLPSIASYITSKFQRFTGSRTVQRILGQSRSVLDFEKLMNEGRIVLVNLGKGRVGQISADTLCSLLLARFWAAAMKRASVPFDERRDFTLYVDEFHNVASATYAELLAEARKYRLGLVLANQFISQLPEAVVQSILGNVGCILSFRVGPNDAELLSKVFQPVFGPADLVDLPILHAYVSCLVGGGEVSRPFSVRCVRDAAVRDPQQATAIREMSRLQWGTPAAEVDIELATRRDWIRSLEEAGRPASS